jgi:hypothetical protein
MRIVSTLALLPDLGPRLDTRILLRNVVWMFDSKGSGNAELGYLEPSDISDYLSPYHDIQRFSNLIPPSHVPQAFQLRRSSTQQVPHRTPRSVIRNPRGASLRHFRHHGRAYPHDPRHQQLLPILHRHGHK